MFSRKTLTLGLAFWLLFSQTVLATVQTFTAASTNWTCPANVFTIFFEGWGDGGGTANSTTAGRGGGGGGEYRADNIAVTPGTVYVIAVGQGGAINGSGAGTSFGDGTAVTASGGLRASTATGGLGGSGGIGATGFNGGHGGNGGGTAGAGGGGGTAGDTGGVGGNGANAVTTTPGAGGTAPAGGTAANGPTGGAVGSPGIVGTNYGSGASGAGSGTQAGAKGAPGFARMTYTAVSGALLVGTQPTSNITATTLSSIVVNVTDSGLLTTDASNNSTMVTATLASGTSGAVLSGTTTATCSAGVATFNTLKINAVGSYTIAFTATNFITATSNAFTVTLNPTWEPTQTSIAPALLIPDWNIKSLYVNTSNGGGFNYPVPGAAYSATPAISGNVAQVMSQTNGHMLGFDPPSLTPTLFAGDSFRHSGLWYGTGGGAGGAATRLIVANSLGAFNFFHSTATFSLAYCIKPDSVTSLQFVCQNNDLNMTTPGFTHWINTNGTLELQYYDGATVRSMTSTSALVTVGHWYQVFIVSPGSAGAVSFTITDLTVPATSTVTSTGYATTASGTADAKYNFTFGVDGSGANPLQGVISGFGIWPGALTGPDQANIAAYNPVQDSTTYLAKQIVSGASISPNGLSHLYFWTNLSDSTQLAVNANGTGGAPTGGGNVEYVANKTEVAGQVRHREAKYDTGSAAPPLFQTNVVNGLSAVQWNGTDTHANFLTSTRGDNNLIMYDWPHSDLTAIFAYQNIPTGSDAPSFGAQGSKFFEAAGSADTSYFIACGNSYGSNAVPGIGNVVAHPTLGVGTSGSPPGMSADGTKWHVGIIFKTASTFEIMIDGVSSGVSTYTGPFTCNYANWGGTGVIRDPNAASTWSANGYMAGDFALYNICHSHKSAMSVARHLAAQLGTPFPSSGPSKQRIQIGVGIRLSENENIHKVEDNYTLTP